MPTLSSRRFTADPLIPLPPDAIARPAIARVRSEFLEMPNLALTTDQARRLFGMPSRLCEHVLDQLVVEGFLRLRRGAYTVVGQA
ncbi:MAG: hypothetical protein IT181_27815 [Acidobacteria bacterium]|nr:hypothetical protein [Acidobacteriota bacterium]